MLRKINRILGSTLALLLACSTASSEESVPAGFHQLALGDAAPDFKLPGVDGKTHRLADFKSAPVLMVVFLSNHCPTSHAAVTRLVPLAAAMKSRGLAVVAINPNHPDALSIDELA